MYFRTRWLIFPVVVLASWAAKATVARGDGCVIVGGCGKGCPCGDTECRNRRCGASSSSSSKPSGVSPPAPSGVKGAVLQGVLDAARQGAGRLGRAIGDWIFRRQKQKQSRSDLERDLEQWRRRRALEEEAARQRALAEEAARRKSFEERRKAFEEGKGALLGGLKREMGDNVGGELRIKSVDDELKVSPRGVRDAERRDVLARPREPSTEEAFSRQLGVLQHLYATVEADLQRVNGEIARVKDEIARGGDKSQLFLKQQQLFLEKARLKQKQSDIESVMAYSKSQMKNPSAATASSSGGLFGTGESVPSPPESLPAPAPAAGTPSSTGAASPSAVQGPRPALTPFPQAEPANQETGTLRDSMAESRPTPTGTLQPVPAASQIGRPSGSPPKSVWDPAAATPRLEDLQKKQAELDAKLKENDRLRGTGQGDPAKLQWEHYQLKKELRETESKLNEASRAAGAPPSAARGTLQPFPAGNAGVRPPAEPGTEAARATGSSPPTAAGQAQTTLQDSTCFDTACKSGPGLDLSDLKRARERRPPIAAPAKPDTAPDRGASPTPDAASDRGAPPKPEAPADRAAQPRPDAPAAAKAPAAEKQPPDDTPRKADEGNKPAKPEKPREPSPLPKEEGKPVMGSDQVKQL